MPRKKQSKEEILLKAKLARRERYAKIKSDPEKYALEKEKEHQRYLKRKAEKKILTIAEMTPKARKQQRKKWRENFQKHYKKSILQKRGLQLMHENTPSGSDSESEDQSEARIHHNDPVQDPLLDSESVLQDKRGFDPVEDPLLDSESVLQDKREFETPAKKNEVRTHMRKNASPNVPGTSSSASQNAQPASPPHIHPEVIATPKDMTLVPSSTGSTPNAPSGQRNIKIREKNSDVIEKKNQQIKRLQLKVRQLQYIIERQRKNQDSRIEQLLNKIEAYKKLTLRLKKRLQSPNTKITNMIKDRSKIQEVKKKVLFGEAIKESLETNYKDLKSKKDKKEFSNVILKDKNTLQKYKVLSETKNFTVRNTKEESEKSDSIYEKLKEDIKCFFERDDVSRLTAGKKDCITQDKVKKQKRYLLDTMKNLHKVFEKDISKVSYSYFCKQRPFWVLIPNVNDRETCLCQIHANIELLLQALHKEKIVKEKDTKELINSLSCSNSCLMDRCPTCKDKKIEYNLSKQEPIWISKWEYRKESFTSKGVEKEKRAIEKSKQLVHPREAVEELEKTLPTFLKHEGTRRWQFFALKDLKENLRENEAIIHIDFSENYTLKYAAEVQSCHFDQKQLTLHTAVIYLLGENGQITCKSFCTVSKNKRHDAAAVWAHVVPLLNYIHTASKNIDTLHFQSDSPSSQYRNKKMFYIISKLCWFFPNLNRVTWNYSEAGHGKGAADGVGGTVKRNADAAVANGKDVVTIEDFIATVKESSEKITVEPVEDYEIYEKDMLIPENVKPLKGANKVHQVLWKKNDDTLIFREVSCMHCLDIDCRHTKFVGKLTYAENDTCALNQHEPIPEKPLLNNSHENVSKQNQSKTDLLRKIRKPTKGKHGCKKDKKGDEGKENLKITSNILVKPAKKPDIKVKMLSEITPDNKINSSAIDLSDMVNLYNISGIEANFSGIFEDFARSRNDDNDADISLSSLISQEKNIPSKSTRDEFKNPITIKTHKADSKLDISLKQKTDQPNNYNMLDDYNEKNIDEPEALKENSKQQITSPDKIDQIHTEYPDISSDEDIF